MTRNQAEELAAVAARILNERTSGVPTSTGNAQPSPSVAAPEVPTTEETNMGVNEGYPKLDSQSPCDSCGLTVDDEYLRPAPIAADEMWCAWCERDYRSFDVGPLDTTDEEHDRDVRAVERVERSRRGVRVSDLTRFCRDDS